MEKVDVKKMSVQDIVKALEDKSISPEKVDKNILKQCVVVMKNWGYRNSEIGSILNVSERSIQRYVNDVRVSNSLATTIDFQKHFMAEAINNFRTQYYRLIRISHTEDITTFEKTKAIFAACQVLKDVIVILERLGYVSIENTLKIREEEEKKILEKNKTIKFISESVSDYSALTRDQQKDVIKHWYKDSDYLNNKLFKSISKIAAENKAKGIKGEPIEKSDVEASTPVAPSDNKTS
jgi:hypothetical protein